MEQFRETDTAIRTFDREIRLLQSAAERVRRVNGGAAAIGDAAASAARATPVTAPPHMAEVADLGTTISAALIASDAAKSKPQLRFLGGSNPEPDRLLACGAPDADAPDLRRLLVQTDQPMTSFVPDHGLRLSTPDKTPGR